MMETSAERDRHDIARGVGTNYAGFVARLGSRLPFLVLAGILFGETLFGQYTFAVVIVETAAAIAVFGLKRSLFKFMSEAASRGEDVHGPVAHALALSLTTGTVMAVGLFGAAPTIAVLARAPATAEPLRWLAPVVLLMVMADTLLVTIRYTREMRYEVAARSIGEPAVLVVTLLVAYGLGAREAGLFIAYFASLAVAAILSLVFFLRVYSLDACLRQRLRWGEMRALIGFSGPTAVYDFLLPFAARVDVILVTYFFPEAVVGIYGMAWQFSTFVKKVRAGFDPIVTPVVSQSIAVGDMARVGDHLTLVSRWILSVQILVLLFFALFGQEVLGLMGGQFGAAGLILTFLVLGETLNGTFGVSEFPLLYLRPLVNVALGVGVVLGNAALAALFILMLDAPEGAALGVAASAALVNGARLVLNARYFGLHLLRRTLLKPIAAGAVAGAVALAVRWIAPGPPGLGVVLGIVGLLGSYPMALYGLGLEPEDRAQIRRVAGRAA